MAKIKKPLKVILWIISSIVFLIAIGIAIIAIGQRFSSLILKEIVIRNVPYKCVFDFEDLQLDIFDKKLHLSQIDFKPLPSDNLPPRTYSISVKDITCDLESITSIYFDRDLLIKDLQIKGPEIDIEFNDQDKPKQSFSRQTGDLYKLISGYLRELKIEKFRLAEGKIYHKPSNLALSGINFSFDNIKVDSVANKKRIFYSESINLEINQQRLYLPDSIHVASFDQLVLSTKDSILLLKNFSLTPRKDASQLFESDQKYNVYDITLPYIRIKGVDYYKAYQDNHLIISDLLIDNPTLIIDDETHTDRKVKNNDNSIIKLILDVFDVLDIGKFKLIDAKLDLKLFATEQEQEINTENANIDLYSIHLDSNNFIFDKNKQYFENAIVNIKDYTYSLPDSLHEVYVDEFTLNTFNSNVSLSQISINPSMDPDNAEDLKFKGKILGLNLKGFDYQETILSSDLRLDEIEIVDAGFFIETPKLKSQNDKPSTDPSDIQKKVSEIFNILSTKSFKLINGSLNIDNTTLAKGIFIDLKDMELGPGLKSWHDLSGYCDISLEEFIEKSPYQKVELGKIYIRNQFYDLEINNGSLYQNGVLAIFKKAAVHSINLDSLLASKKQTADSLVLENASLEIDLSKTRQANNPSDIRFDRIFVKNSDLNITQKTGGTLKVREFSGSFLNESNNYLAEQFTLKHFNFLNNQVKQVLNIEAVEFSNEKLSLNHIAIDYPIGNNQISLNTPLVELNGFSQQKFMSDSIMIGQALFITDPVFNLDIKEKFNFERSKREKSQFPVTLENINLSNARITFNQNIEKDTARGNVTGLHLKLQNFKYPGNKPFDYDQQLYSDNLDIAFDSLSFITKSSDSINIITLDFDNLTNDLSFGLNFQNRSKGLYLDFPSLTFININAGKYFADNSLELDSLLVDGSETNIRLKSNDEISSDSIALPFKKVRTGFLSQTNGTFKFFNPTDSISFTLNDFKSELVGLQLDSLMATDEIPKKIDNFSFSGKNFEYPLNKDYNLILGEYSGDLSKKRFSLKDIQLDPNLDAKAYSKKLKYQKDWFNASADEVVSTGFSISEFINRKYFVEHIEVKGLELDVYRDKNNIFPSDQRVGLPQKLLYEAQPTVKIDTLSVTGNISYTELAPKSEVPGVIHFDNLNGELRHIVTEKSLSKHPMSLFATGNLMGVGDFEARVMFDMQSPEHDFVFTGLLKKMELPEMNKILVPNANVNIKSGVGKQTYFKFKANNAFALGEMKFRYDDLKIQILNPETHDTQGFGQGIKTFFANTFVVRKNNPRFLFLRNGEIFQERDRSRAIFNYWGKSILSGVISSIGINKSKKEEKKYLKTKD